MLKKQYQLLLIITILIASTSQILARTIDIPPSKSLPSNPQQFLKTNKPLSDPSIKRVKKEALSPPSQNNYSEKIIKKTLAPHLNFSVSEIGKATTTLGGTRTICSSKHKQTVCLFGKPSPTECAIHYPSFCGKDKQTFCPEPLGYASPTKCPNGHTQATKCPYTTIQTNCPHGITATKCVGLYGEKSEQYTECPRLPIKPTHCPYIADFPTNCGDKILATHCFVQIQNTHCIEKIFPTTCPDDLVYPTVCKIKDDEYELSPTTCFDGIVIATECPDRILPTWCVNIGLVPTRCPDMQPRHCLEP